MLFLTYQMVKLNSNEESLSARIWRNRHFHTELLGETATSRAETQEIHKEDRSVPESEDVSEDSRDVPEERGSWRGEAPIGQI